MPGVFSTGRGCAIAIPENKTIADKTTKNLFINAKTFQFY
jgi:hypothetical protein